MRPSSSPAHPPCNRAPWPHTSPGGAASPAAVPLARPQPLCVARPHPIAVARPHPVRVARPHPFFRGCAAATASAHCGAARQSGSPMQHYPPVPCTASQPQTSAALAAAQPAGIVWPSGVSQRPALGRAVGCFATSERSGNSDSGSGDGTVGGGDGGDGGGVDAAASTQRRKELHHHSRRGAGEPPAEASQRSSDGQAGEVHEASGRQNGASPSHRSSSSREASEKEDQRHGNAARGERVRNKGEPSEAAGKQRGDASPSKRSSSRKAPVQEVGDQRDGAARGDRASSSNTAVERNPASTAEAPSRNSDAVHEASRRHRDRSPGKGRLALQAAQDASRARRPPSGMLTPIAAKEARLQAVQQQHNERSRALARERQQILQNQAMWTGSMAPLERVGTPEARVSARAELVGRLQAEQAAAEVLLEELRQNKSYRQAQEAAQRVAAAMAEVQHNAAQSPEPLTMPGFRDDARAPGTLGTRNSRSGRTADGAHVSVLTPGINTPQLAKTPLARRTPGSTTGHDMDTRSAFTAKSTSLVFHEPDVRRHPLDAPLPPSPPLPQQQQREMDGRTSEFVEDLRSQVAALQEAVQSQMEWQQHAAHAHMHALEQVQMQAAQQQQQQAAAMAHAQHQQQQHGGQHMHAAAAQHQHHQHAAMQAHAAAAMHAHAAAAMQAQHMQGGPPHPSAAAAVMPPM
uniref:Uncharacterized protein n=1 Tax=Chlamydomonas euryale TaxID=1486919 RepID=A0A6U2HGZ0_9CHLO|mmetsp:Transcript_3803/g.10816  ORF Transcript_3803/g.10816 Transcript_3803/m.10816 type:complete len:690 (+) Transcript_3803:430-2499(+)